MTKVKVEPKTRVYFEFPFWVAEGWDEEWRYESEVIPRLGMIKVCYTPWGARSEAKKWLQSKGAFRIVERCDSPDCRQEQEVKQEEQ